MKIYLAGKIEQSGWRETIVDKLSNANADLWYPIEFPILEKSIFKIHDYVGPYFIACDHGGFHGNNSHGVYATDRPNIYSVYCSDRLQNMPSKERQNNIMTACLKTIDTANLVFAWIDDTSCYGTLAELGYAKAKEVKIFIAGPKKFSDLWFIYQMADRSVFNKQLTPATALDALLMKQTMAHTNTAYTETLGIVYVIQSNGYIKIGHTQNLSRRISQLQSASATKIEIKSVIKGGRKLEQELHTRYKQYTVHGEWFQPNDKMMGFLRAIGSDV